MGGDSHKLHSQSFLHSLQAALPCGVSPLQQVFRFGNLGNGAWDSSTFLYILGLVSPAPSPQEVRFQIRESSYTVMHLHQRGLGWGLGRRGKSGSEALPPQNGCLEFSLNSCSPETPHRS